MVNQVFIDIFYFLVLICSLRHTGETLVYIIIYLSLLLRHFLLTETITPRKGDLLKKVTEGVLGIAVTLHIKNFGVVV